MEFCNSRCCRFYIECKTGKAVWTIIREDYAYSACKPAHSHNWFMRVTYVIAISNIMSPCKCQRVTVDLPFQLRLIQSAHPTCITISMEEETELTKAFAC
jgi:hypothetical protein